MSKRKSIKKIFFKTIFVVVFLIAMQPVAQVMATTIYLEPVSKDVYYGQNFIVEVRLKLDPGEDINLLAVTLNYPAAVLEPIDVSFKNSILSIITHEAKIDQAAGTIQFAGGIPGGYRGRIAGDPATGDIIAQIGFKARVSQAPNAALNFSTKTQVFLNDGKGTLAQTILQGSKIELSAPPIGFAADEWNDLVTADTIQPEPFQAQIQRDPKIFGGRYFITFYTNDKQTAVERYEVSESKVADVDYWQKTQSPYELKDQSLSSYIKIKAVDLGGNERLVILPPTRTQSGNAPSAQNPLGMSWLVPLSALVLALILLTLSIFLKRKNKLP